MKETGHESFLDKFKKHSLDRTLIQIQFNKPLHKFEQPKKVVITSFESDGILKIKLVSYSETQAFTTVHDTDEIGEIFAKWSQSFGQIILHANPDIECILLQSKNGASTILNKKLTKKVNQAQTHNDIKQYKIPVEAPFLKDLGIVNASGNISQGQGDKWRQIQRYIDLLIPILPSDKTEKLHIVDMGCGKGYLTFALYHYLASNQFTNFVVTGIDIRADLVTKCNQMASTHEFKNLKFLQGDIDSINSLNPNMVIALHACDTATDKAIQYGIENHAKWIITAPCCHKYVRKNMDGGTFKPYLKDGIMEERLAEWLTDSIRKLHMEEHGYNVKITEFISPEHTAKNLMLIATFSGRKNNKAHTSKVELMQWAGLKKWIF